MTALLRHCSAGLVCALLLSGCSRGMDDLETWVGEVKSRKTKAIEPIPQIKQYEAFAYVPGDRRDPFVPPASEETAHAPTGTAGPHPDLNRNKEPLEAFPLDALRMQGTIKTSRALYALVKSPDSVVHRVAAGDHMGQNYGEVKTVTDEQIELVELVPDGFGGWMPRASTLVQADKP